MTKYIYIMLGGAVGSLLRFLMADFIASRNTTVFPAGTFSVNLIGSLLIGLLFGFFSQNGEVDDKIRFLVFIGFFGGFTTFSSFALENIKLLNSGLISASIFYVFLSNIGGIGLAFAGYLIGLKFK